MATEDFQFIENMVIEIDKSRKEIEDITTICKQLHRLSLAKIEHVLGSSKEFLLEAKKLRYQSDERTRTIKLAAIVQNHVNTMTDFRESLRIMANCKNI